MRMSRSADYWEKRAQLREQAATQKIVGLEKELRRTYARGFEAIQGKIDALQRRYAEKYGLSYADAIEKLTPEEQAAWQDYANEYVRQMADRARYPLAEMQYDALSIRVRISRLEALKTDIDLAVSRIMQEVNDQAAETLGEVYVEGYQMMMFDLFKERGEGYDIGRLLPKRVQEIVQYPWSGAGFSQRIWRNREQLAFQLKESLTKGLIRGDGLPQIAQELKETMGVSYRSASRLVRTESNHLFNQATIDGYKRDGIEEYRFLATLDSTTCKRCGALDREKFKVEDAKAGVNLPPLHPHDRCTTVPVIWEDLESDNSTRIARDADGEWYQVPAEMTFEAWRKKQTE